MKNAARGDQCTNKANGNKTLTPTGRIFLTIIAKAPSVSCWFVISIEILLGSFENNGNHTWDKEHKYRQEFKANQLLWYRDARFITTGIILSTSLSKNTLNNMPIGTPIPETDDGCAKETQRNQDIHGTWDHLHSSGTCASFRIRCADRCSRSSC